MYASGCNRIDQTRRVGMHSLLASPTWKHMGYAEKVENDQVILRVLNLIQYNMTNAELLSRQYWIFTNTAPKSRKKVC